MAKAPKEAGRAPSAAPLVDDVSAVLASGDGPWSSVQIRGVLDLGTLGAARVSSALWRLRKSGAARALLWGRWVGPSSRWWDAPRSELTAEALAVLRLVVAEGTTTTVALAKRLRRSRWTAWSHLRSLEARRLVCKEERALGGRLTLWAATASGRRLAERLPEWGECEEPLGARLVVHERRARGVIVERPGGVGVLVGCIAPAHRDGERGWVVVRVEGGALDERACLETFRPSRVEAERVAELLWQAVGAEVVP